MLARLLALGEAPDPAWGAALAIAELYAVRNDPDQAFKWLHLARSRMQSTGMPVPDREMKRNLQLAPFLKPLHADPRWTELLASLDEQ